MSDIPKTLSETDTDGLDPKSLAAIRELLASEPVEPPAPAPKAEPRKVARSAAVATPPERAAVKHDAASRAPKAPHTPKEAPTSRHKAALSEQAEPGFVARIKASVLGYRPTPKHIMLASIALLVFFWPWVVIGLMFLTVFIVTGVFLMLGYDGFWRRAMGIARWHARRNPARSAELHRRLDDFAMKFDAFLDRFPEGTVDGLYLPDFGDLAEAEARHDEALNRRFETLRET